MSLVDYLLLRSKRFAWEYIINTARLIYICLREFFQYRVIYKEKYFKMSSNLVEIFLILLPFLLYFALAVFSIFPCQEPFYAVGFIEAVNILVMIVATALLYSTPKFSAHLRCYKKILLSYMSVFLNFFPLFIGVNCDVFRRNGNQSRRHLSDSSENYYSTDHNHPHQQSKSYNFDCS